MGFLSSARVAKVRQPLVQSVTKELSVGYLEDESGLPKPSSQYLHTQHSNLLCTLVQQKTLLISIGSCFLKKNKVHIDFTQMNFFIFGLERLNRSLFARSCFLKSWASVSCMNLPWPVDQLVLWAPTGCQVGFAPHHCLCLSNSERSALDPSTVEPRTTRATEQAQKSQQTSHFHLLCQQRLVAIGHLLQTRRPAKNFTSILSFNLPTAL